MVRQDIPRTLNNSPAANKYFAVTAVFENSWYGLLMILKSGNLAIVPTVVSGALLHQFKGPKTPRSISIMMLTASHRIFLKGI